MIEAFDVKDQALGTGDNAAYTFDFKIYDPTHLLIYVQDGSGNIVQQIRGDDTTYLSGIVFDSVNGGGTVTLVNNLDDTFVMTFMLAPDFPDQPTAFPNKTSFSLDMIEGALDYLASQIQRIAWIAQRSMRMHDLDDIDNFDPTLPISIANYPGGVVSIKEDGSGFEITTTVNEIAAAQGNAAAALVSAGNSAASAVSAAASALAAAASAALAATGFFTVGTRALPGTVVAATGFVPSGKPRELQFLQSAGGTVLVTANPQIPHGTVIGQEFVIVGGSDANVIHITNGNGLDLNGDMFIGNGDTLGLCWDGTNWSEMYRRSAT